MKTIIMILLIVVLVSGCNKEQTKQDIVNELHENYKNYILENDEELVKKLADYKNNITDRVVDDELQQKVDILIGHLTEELTANEVMEYGYDGLLWQLYDVDNVLNPKNVSMFVIN